MQNCHKKCRQAVQDQSMTMEKSWEKDRTDKEHEKYRRKLVPRCNIYLYMKFMIWVVFSCVRTHQANTPRHWPLCISHFHPFLRWTFFVQYRHFYPAHFRCDVTRLATPPACRGLNLRRLLGYRNSA